MLLHAENHIQLQGFDLGHQSVDCHKSFCLLNNILLAHSWDKSIYFTLESLRIMIINWILWNLTYTDQLQAIIYIIDSIQ